MRGTKISQKHTSNPNGTPSSLISPVIPSTFSFP